MKIIRRYKTEMIVILTILCAAASVRMMNLLWFQNHFDFLDFDFSAIRHGSLSEDLPTALFPVCCALGVFILGFIPSEKFLDRQKRLSRLRGERQKREEYCEWINDRTADFIRFLEKRDFRATWGFQLTQDVRYGDPCGDLCVFDLPALEIVAVDEDSEQLLYCTYTGLTYERYLKGDRIPDYQYALIPLSKVYHVYTEYEDYTVPVEKTVRETTPWHGMAWTSDGITPVSGASIKFHKETENKFIGSKTVLKICTGIPEHKEIVLTVRERKVSTRRWGKWTENIRPDKSLMLDARCGILGRRFPFIELDEAPVDRKESDFDPRIRAFKGKLATVLDCRYNYVFRTGEWINIKVGSEGYASSWQLVDKKIESLLPEGDYEGRSRKYDRSGTELDKADLIWDGIGISGRLDDNAKYLNALCDKIRREGKNTTDRDAEKLFFPSGADEVPADEPIVSRIPEAEAGGTDTPTAESDDSTITVELQMDTTNKARAIIELAKLKREGLITKDEFDKLKNELMEQDS